MASTALSASRKSTKRALLLSLAFGAISAVLVVTYLNSSRQEANQPVVTASVVFAARDIPERTVIKEGMLEVRQVPVDAKHNLAIQEMNRAVGQISRVRIAAGEQVLTNKIADQVRDVGFSATIPDGKRAVAVGVTEVIASGGHIAPGDYVDVIGVFEVFVPTDGNGKPTTGGSSNSLGGGQSDKLKAYSSLTILQNIQVLAVAEKSDTTLQSEKERAQKASSADQAKSVTLAVTPEQAQKLFMAEELGKLRLSLRPFGEDEHRSVTPASNTLADLMSGQ